LARITARAIMYPDNRRTYPSVWRYYRSDQIFDVDPEIEEAGEISDEEEHDEDNAQ
jgi:hypothetical protein